MRTIAPTLSPTNSWGASDKFADKAAAVFATLRPGVWAFDEDALEFAEWRPYTNPKTGKTGWISEGGLVRKEDPRKKEQEKREKQSTAQTAIATAVGDPSRLHEGHVEALHDHVKTVDKAHLVNVARQLRVKLGGPKAAVADRILAYVQGHRAATAALPPPPPPAPPPEPVKDKNATDPDTGRPDTPQRGRVYQVATKSLKVDPARFQFKTNTNAKGVTKELAGVKVFNPDFAGVMSVWRDPANGEDNVINGHHRHDLAERTGQPDVAVRYITAPDAKSARAVGALINIAEGRGTSVDAAKFMRDSGVTADDFAKYGVSMNGALAKDANDLTHLNDRVFDRLARGTLELPTALAIGRHLPDPELQNTLVSYLDKLADKNKTPPANQIVEMAKEMAATPTASTTTQSLWGDIEDTQSLFGPRNELKAFVRNELAKAAGDFNAVAGDRRASNLGAAGNKLDTAGNKARAYSAEQDKTMFDLKANSAGGRVSTALNAAAELLLKAKSQKEKNNARKQALAGVRAAIEAEFATIGGRGSAAQ